MNASAARARLFVSDELAAGISIQPSREQQHYLLTVMRCRDGDPVLVFNGRDGEWQTEVQREGRRDCQLLVRHETRRQTSSPDLWLLFAPVKKARLDFIAQKASEMGCSRIWPVRTDHCQVSRVNDDRMLANAVEAAEQTERLDIAEIMPFTDLVAALDACKADRHIIFCDEASAGAGDMNAVRVLTAAAPVAKAAIVIGPEGGFSEDERELISNRQNSLKLSLGPRILRADTAAIAALACFQSVCGDWT
jgi:16S rRNA (uracil1498-N3)-methyltransferase